MLWPYHHRSYFLPFQNAMIESPNMEVLKSPTPVEEAGVIIVDDNKLVSI